MCKRVKKAMRNKNGWWEGREGIGWERGRWECEEEGGEKVDGGGDRERWEEGGEKVDGGGEREGESARRREEKRWMEEERGKGESSRRKEEKRWMEVERGKVRVQGGGRRKVDGGERGWWEVEGTINGYLFERRKNQRLASECLALTWHI